MQLQEFTATSFKAQDAETGFLIRDPDRELVNGFESQWVCTPAVKLRILNFLLGRWNISKACASAGITRQTFQRHYQTDESFKQCVDEIHDRHVDNVEEVRHDMALIPSGSFDRMCLLNAYRREIYNPKVQVEVQHTITREEGARRLKDLSSVIDAEIVETVQKIKKQRGKMLRPQNPNGQDD